MFVDDFVVSRLRDALFWLPEASFTMLNISTSYSKAIEFDCISVLLTQYTFFNGHQCMYILRPAMPSLVLGNLIRCMEYHSYMRVYTYLILLFLYFCLLCIIQWLFLSTCVAWYLGVVWLKVMWVCVGCRVLQIYIYYLMPLLDWTIGRYIKTCKLRANPMQTAHQENWHISSRITVYTDHLHRLLLWRREQNRTSQSWTPKKGGSTLLGNIQHNKFPFTNK
jgi:hypothetical protein